MVGRRSSGWARGGSSASGKRSERRLLSRRADRPLVGLPRSLTRSSGSPGRPLKDPGLRPADPPARKSRGCPVGRSLPGSAGSFSGGTFGAPGCGRVRAANRRYGVQRGVLRASERRYA
jgi:hypothetical protein